MNCAAVLRAVRDRGPARASDLMRVTGLSRPTVTAALAQLVADGWVEETGPSATDLPRMGRPARLLRFRADARHVVGVDVGPHRLHCAAADLNGTVVAQRRMAVAASGPPERMITLIARAIEETAAAIPVATSSLAAVGVGTPGIVDAAHGVVVRAPSLPGWESLDLAALLGGRVHCPVHVENDVNLAVIAEQSDGVGSDAASMLLVHWGARIGGAVLVHGQIHRGRHGAAGEIGHVDLREHPQGDIPERLGPMEAQVGTARITRRARELGSTARGSRPDGGPAGPTGASPDGGAEVADAVAVLTAAATGEPAALRALDEACAQFARGLAPFLAALDPELLVLGGSIRLAGPAVLDAVRRHLAHRVLVVPPMELSALGDEAIALGGVRLALADAERRILDAYAPAG